MQIRERTLSTERLAEEVVQLVCEYGINPDTTALDKAFATLLPIEEWKAMCLRQAMGNAARNSRRSVWDAMHGAIFARSDVEAILSIMRLIGFGSYQDGETGQRGAKRATAVMRFLKPVDWGVVDWRTIAMLTRLDDNNWDIDRALAEAKKLESRELRSLFDVIDERMACAVNVQYRARRTAPVFTRTAEVEMSIFGLSMLAWPFASAAQR